MRKRQPINYVFAGLLIASFTACGSTDVQEERQQQMGLGETVTQAGETQVQQRTTITQEALVQHDIPTITVSRQLADINRMNPEHFSALGFPDDVAQRIVEYRDQQGGFQSVEDLQQVQGVNPSMYREISPRLGLSPAE